MDQPLPDDGEPQRAQKRRSAGLGRNLSDILSSGADAGTEVPLLSPPSAADCEDRSPQGVYGSTLSRSIVTACLDAIAGLVGLDVTAYLYRPPGQGYRLAIADVARSPASIGFELFDLMRDAAQTAEPEWAVSLGGYELIVIASPGPWAPSVYVIGRFGRPPTDEQIDAARHLFRLIIAARELDEPRL